MKISDKIIDFLQAYKNTILKQRENENEYTIAFDMGAVTAFETAISIALQEEAGCINGNFEWTKGDFIQKQGENNEN